MTTGPDGRPAPVSTDGHVDLDLLAEVDADLHDAATRAQVSAHIAGCEQCSALQSALAATRLELSQLPSPPMPDDVAARLSAALDAERDASAPLDEPGQPDPTLSPTVSRLDTARARRGRTRTRVMGWAAAAILVLSGGTATWAFLTDGQDPGQGTLAEKPDQVDRTGEVGEAEQPSGDAGASREDPGLFPSDEGAGAAPDGAGLPSYTSGNIEENIEDILVQAYCGETGQCPSSQAGALADENLRNQCSAALARHGVNGEPQAVQYARFDGELAYVFVFDDERAVVVSGNCGVSSGMEILYGG